MGTAEFRGILALFCLGPDDPMDSLTPDLLMTPLAPGLDPPTTHWLGLLHKGPRTSCCRVEEMGSVARGWARGKGHSLERCSEGLRGQEQALPPSRELSTG